MKNIMNKLTLKHMMTNKKRTLVTMLGIIISVAMFTAVTTGVTSVMNFFQRMEMEDSGYWHVGYNNISQDAAKQLESEGNTKNIALFSDLGYAKFPQSQNEDRPYVYVTAMDDTAFDMMNVKLIEGRLPENENEIIIQKPMQKTMKQPYQIGDTIHVQYGIRYTETEGIRTELTQDTWYQSGKYEDQEKESFEETSNHHEYTIVGIMERPGFESYAASGYTMLTRLNPDTVTRLDAKLYLKHVKRNIFDVYKEKETELDAENTVFNYSALMYYGVSRTDTFNRMMLGMAGILIAIIMVGAVSLIYNSFAISISERSRQFGMLSSIGTTKGQQMHAVLFEGFVSGCVSIPVGILSGILGIDITFRLLGPMLKNTFEIDQTFETIVSVTGIIISVIVSIITILISAYIPSRKAAKITAMEAIRQQKDIKVSPKEVKTSRLTRKMFGFEGELAMKGLKRNRKRYRAIVFSLGISIVLFISVNAYTYYLSKAVATTNESNEGDVTVGSFLKEEVNILLPKLSELNSLSELTVNGYVPLQLNLVQNDVQSVITKELKDYLEQNYYEASDIRFETMVIDDAAYEKLLKDSNSTAMENTAQDQIPVIISNQMREYHGYSMKDLIPVKVKCGQTMDVQVMEYDRESQTDIPKQQLTLVTEAVTTKLPLGMSVMTTGNYVQLIISESNAEKLMEVSGSDQTLSYRIIGNTNNPQGVNKEIETVINTELSNNNGNSSSSDFYISNRAEDAIRSKQLITIFNVFAYGFITLISLISIANMCNTISTSFAVRRREFAMLKSVGMTPGKFQNMIVFESILYGLKALLVGLPVGAVFNFLIYKTVSGNFDSKYAFPYQTYLIAIVSVFVVVFVAMLYSTAKTRKDNIIDGLKSEVI